MLDTRTPIRERTCARACVPTSVQPCTQMENALLAKRADMRINMQKNMRTNRQTYMQPDVRTDAQTDAQINTQTHAPHAPAPARPRTTAAQVAYGFACDKACEGACEVASGWPRRQTLRPRWWRSLLHIQLLRQLMYPLLYPFLRGRRFDWPRLWEQQSGRLRRQTGRYLAAAVLHLLVMSAAHAVDVQDDRGRTLRFDRPAARVVSLLPSLTESVCSLGACDRLVGVDRYSDWPAQVQRLPKLGGGLNPNIEAIVALRPDVVLVSESSRASDRLSALGIKVVALRTQTHADVRKGLDRIAAVLGLPASRADAVWQGIEQGIARAAQTVPAAARGKRVFIEVSRGPFAAGASSFIGQTLSALGMQNVVPAAQGPFPKLNPEFVVRADPDLIMFTDRAAQEAGLYPGWQHLRAVRQQRICRFSQQESNLLIHPSPRMADGAAVLARCIAQQLGQ